MVTANIQRQNIKLVTKMFWYVTSKRGEKSGKVPPVAGKPITYMTASQVKEETGTHVVETTAVKEM